MKLQSGILPKRIFWAHERVISLLLSKVVHWVWCSGGQIGLNPYRGKSLGIALTDEVSLGKTLKILKVLIFLVRLQKWIKV